MSVSLVALLVEISKDHPLLPHIHFSAPRPKRPMALADASLTKGGIDNEVETTVAKNRPATSIEKYRGLREFQEISIETLQSDDVQTAKKRNKAPDKEAAANKPAAKMESKCASGPEKGVSQTKVQGMLSVCEGHDNKASQTSDVMSRSSKNAVLAEKPKSDHPVASAAESVCDSHLLTNEVDSITKPKDAVQNSSDSSFIGSDRRNRFMHLTTQIPFSSGNHFVEVTKGLLHLYKENQRSTLAEEAERSEMLCIFGVPAVLTTHDLLQFTAPVSEHIEHLRIIRESKPNQYMVLIKFRNQLSADEFYQNFNGMKFNTIEEEVCHLAYVAKVETVKESEEACLPLPGHTELPTCPVCLERMDESVEGILTILCNHSFHGSCLAKWGDTSCPVCRYCQTPEPEPDNRCFGCGSQDSLWICLICGHIGCGRYVEGHAFHHYLDTQHTYAMQLGNNRVWDYAGDNYVHRLVQNKADGKLIELEPRWMENEEKMDSMQLEYTYLLTSQLEAQRHYFEDKLSRFETDAIKQLEEMKEKTKHAVDERKQLEEKLNRVTKEKQALDKKLTQVTSKLNKLTLELKDEKEMNKCLRQNQHVWQQKLTSAEKSLKEMKEAKEKEIKDLQEQVRDLMFYFEAEKKFQDVPNVSSQEIQEGRIVIGEAAGTSSETAKQRRKKHR